MDHETNEAVGVYGGIVHVRDPFELMHVLKHTPCQAARWHCTAGTIEPMQRAASSKACNFMLRELAYLGNVVLKFPVIRH